MNQTASIQLSKNFGERHEIPNLFSGFKVFYHIVMAFLLNAKLIYQIRKSYKNRSVDKSNPRVVVFSDNLDETNGIAINSRLMHSQMNALGFKYQLIGMVYHTRETGIIEENGTILFPQVFSLQQFGYKESELAIPHLKELLKYFEKNPTDLVELETPSSGASVVLAACKLIGIKCISHYRTDMFYYVDLLVDSMIIRNFTKLWVKAFCRLSQPVIVPSEDFKLKMNTQMGIPLENVKLIDRGIKLSQFSPQNKKGIWPLSQTNDVPRFLYVGRISQEKELEFLLKVWLKYREQGYNGELVFVGQGPYLEILTEQVKDYPEITCVGKKKGEELAAYYAEANFFIFPSGSDTFGNVVVEALASGLPALVSDSGGPKDIVKNKFGRVIPFKNEEEWVKEMIWANKLFSDKSEYEALVKECVDHSSNFTLKNSAEQFWKFYLEVLS